MTRRRSAALAAGVLVALGALVTGCATTPVTPRSAPPVTQPSQPGAHSDAPPTAATAPPTRDAPRPHRVLAIGNSFASGAIIEYLTPLARAGGHDLTVGVAGVAGASLEMHAANIASGSPAYRLQVVGPDGSRESRGGVPLDEALGARDWDVVTVQQSSALSGLPERLDPALTTLVAHIRERLPGARILVHQTWAYAWTAQGTAFDSYGRDQCRMYAGIVETYDRAVAEVDGATVIPTGTAVQLARGGGVPESSLTVPDGMHLNLPHGQFLGALTWYDALFGGPAPTTFAPQGMDAAAAATLRAAADEALAWRDGVRFTVPCRQPA